MVKNAFERLAYIDATIQSFDKERHVWTHILSQSMLGLCVSGLFYGWGALATTIDSVFSPNNSGVFENLHGTFTGVIILVLSVIPMVPLRLILDAKIINEFQSQAIGLFITIVGLVLGGISLKFKILWLLYIGCSVPCGVGSLMVFQRLVFSHQLWFKMIEKQNLGAGIFGFGIGLWTAIFFLISSPLLKLFSIDLVLYLYSALLFLCIIWPLLTINDDILDLVCKTKTSSSSIDNSEAEKIKEDNSDNCNNSHSNFSKINYIGNNDQEQFEIHGNDNFIRHELKKNAEVNLSQETMEITYKEVCNCKQTWIIFFFFAAVLTPGWGIKLASYAMLKNMFTATVEYSSVISALYTAIYAIGRLCSGFLAQVVGIKKTYDIMICTMIVILVLLPETIRNMDHSSQNSLGCKIFVFLICIVGLMYGGCIALFYSLIFDIFGTTNYRKAFSVSFNGFSISVIVGGFSSAYSFSDFNSHSSDETKAIQTLEMCSRWFYSMAATLLLSLCLLHIVTPVKYKVIFDTRKSLDHI